MRDFGALERRRLEGLRLFRKGVPQAQIARELRVARQTVSRWVRQYR
ncbi:MAG: helix-turn-helix domain-containing protein, partial [Bryobacteraceae bacterium]